MPRDIDPVLEKVQWQTLARDALFIPNRVRDDTFYIVNADKKSSLSMDTIKDYRKSGVIDRETEELLLGDRLVLDGLVEHKEGHCAWAEGVPWSLTAADVGLDRVWNVITQVKEMHRKMGRRDAANLRKWACVNVNSAHMGENVSLLALATQFASPKVASALLELRADPNARVVVVSNKSEKNNVTPLHLAAARGSPDMLHTLLMFDAHPYARTRNNESPRTSDMTPMQFAAAFADPATLEVFIDRGHCINGRLEDFEYHGDIGESTRTILAAIDFNNVRNTLHLIERGADYTFSVSLEVCNMEEQGGFPMEFDVIGCCARSNSAQTLAALIDAGYVEGNTDLMAFRGLEIVKDVMTIPPLIAAAMVGSVGCVYALARRGANMDAHIKLRDLSMYSRSSLCALEIAAHNDDTAMMMALVECGSRGMEEALDIATLRRSDSSVNMLLALGANIQDTLRYHIRMNDMDSFRYIAKMGSTYDNHIEVVMDTVLAHTMTLADDRMLQRKKREEVESTLQASRDYNVVTQERVQDAYQRLAVEKASNISLQTQLQTAQNELQGAKLELESEMGRAQVRATRENDTRQELVDTKKQLEMAERKHAVLQKTNAKQAKTQAFLEKENARLTISLKAAEEPIPLQHPECVICLDEVTRDMAVGVLPCMHVFCVRCLDGMSDAPYILKRDACCPFKCDLPELGLMRRWQKIHFA